MAFNLQKQPYANSASEVWWWVQRGRDLFLVGQPMPREQTTDSLAAQMGWRFEKIGADAVENILLVEEAVSIFGS